MGARLDVDVGLVFLNSVFMQYGSPPLSGSQDKDDHFIIVESSTGNRWGVARFETVEYGHGALVRAISVFFGWKRQCERRLWYTRYLLLVKMSGGRSDSSRNVCISSVHVVYHTIEYFGRIEALHVCVQRSTGAKGNHSANSMRGVWTK